MDTQDSDVIWINFGSYDKPQYQYFILLLAAYKGLIPKYDETLEPRMAFPVITLRKVTVETFLPCAYYINRIRDFFRPLFTNEPEKNAALLFLTENVLRRTLPYQAVYWHGASSTPWIENRSDPTVLDLATLAVMYADDPCPMTKWRERMAMSFQTIVGQTPRQVITGFFKQDDDEEAA